MISSSSQRSRRGLHGNRLLALPLLCLLALPSGCALSPVSPPPPAQDPDALRQALARRAAPPGDGLYAELTLTVDGGPRDGTFDLVVRWHADDRLELDAFKDLPFGVRPIFTLVLGPDRYRYERHQDTDTPPDIDEGRLQDFPARHPELAAVYWTREALFLPGGGVTPDAAVTPVVADGAPRWSLVGALRSGLTARWLVDPDTPDRVAEAAITPPDGAPIQLRYRRWEVHAGREWPSRVGMRSGALTIDARLEHLAEGADD